MAGRVVRAVGGRRAEYRPLVSRLTTSTDPVEVASAIRERFGWSQFYVADLDAITGRARPAFDLYQHLEACGVILWVDAGVHTVHEGAEIHRAQVAQIVIGSETLAGLEEGRAIVAALGPERIASSLDLRDGRLIGPAAREADDPLDVAAALIAAGARRIIVLDLARVGGLAGTGTDHLARELIGRYPDVELFVGGGIRDADDLRRLRDAGVAGALVASALHDGRITPLDILGL